MPLQGQAGSVPAPLPRAQGPASWERTRSWTAPACLGSPCSQSPCLQCPPPSLCHAYLCLLAGQSSAGPQLCAVPHGVLACSWSKRPQPETDFRLPHFFLRALEAFALQVLGAQGTDCIFLKQRWAHTWGGIGEKRKQQSSLHRGKERPRPEQRGRPRALSHTAALGCAGQRGGRGACGGVRGALPRLPAPCHLLRRLTDSGQSLALTPGDAHVFFITGVPGGLGPGRWLSGPSLH